MPAWSVIVLIVVANLILGWLILRQFGAAVPRLVGNHLDTAFAALFIGVAVLGWLAFVLAELGWFSVATLGLIWLLLVVSLAIRTVLASDPGSMDDTSGLNPRREEVSPVTGHRSPVIRRPSSLFSSLPNWIEPVALGVWLVIASWLFFRPHQFVTGAADAGAYVNLSAEIAQNGRILIHDDLLATLDPALYPLFLRWLGENAVAPYYILPGFYVMDVPTSTVVPQFYHLHPVWQAIAYGLAGSTAASVHASLLMSGLWALLGALTLYLVVRHFAGWQVALLALLGLSFNALQIWFARYPTTETLSQFVLWGGLWGTGAWLSGRRPAPLWAVLGGLGLGQFFLVRIDAFFIVPVLVLLGVWTWAQQQKASLWFFLPLGLLIGHSLVHGYWQSRPYFFDLFGFGLLLLRQNWLLAAAGAVIGIIFVWAISHFRGQFQHLGRYQQSIRLLMIIAVLLFAAYGWFVRPYSTEVYFWTDPYSIGNIPILDHENLLRLGWYLSPVGVWLGVLGICILLWQVNRKTVVMLATGLLFSALFIWSIRANPHQIYTMRRYVPAAMPLFIVGAACFVAWLASRRRPWFTGLALALAAAWLGGLLWSARGFVTQVDYRGTLAQISQINDRLAPHSILLFNDQAPIGQGDILGTPLRFLYGHDVLTLRQPDDERLSGLSHAIQQWQAAGRTVYWIDVPAGQVEKAPLASIRLLQPYQVETTILEMTYDHRPSALVQLAWSGDIYLLEPVPTAVSQP